MTACFEFIVADYDRTVWSPEDRAAFEACLTSAQRVYDQSSFFDAEGHFTGSWMPIVGDPTPLVQRGKRIELRSVVPANLMVTLLELLNPLRTSGIREAPPTQVVLPGLGLLAIKQTTVLYNVCTDVLQVHLDQGWRILAVCPQEGNRRPDYVLGRGD